MCAVFASRRYATYCFESVLKLYTHISLAYIILNLPDVPFLGPLAKGLFFFTLSPLIPLKEDLPRRKKLTLRDLVTCAIAVNLVDLAR